MSTRSFSLPTAAVYLLVVLASPSPLNAQREVSAARASSHPDSLADHLVELAITQAGTPLDRLRRLQRSARRASWLPDLRLRIRRGFGRDTYRRHDQTTGPPNTSFDEDLHLEMSVSLQLSGLIYPRAVTSLARYEAEARRFERQLREQVITTYFEWLSIRCSGVNSPALVDPSRRLRLARLEADLRAFTGLEHFPPADSEEWVDMQTRRLCASPIAAPQ